jgi:DNA-binding LacI/PurR family transcriptional regulator
MLKSAGSILEGTDFHELAIKSRLAERVGRFLKSELQRGRWKDCLPSERRLCRLLNVSRPTVRIALRILQSEGLLRLHGNQPARVGRASPHRRMLTRNPRVMVLYDSRSALPNAFLNYLTESLMSQLQKYNIRFMYQDTFARGSRRIARTLTEIERDFQPSISILFSVPEIVHRWFEKEKLPSMILGSRHPGIHLSAIDVHWEAMTRHAVEYLARQGHRRLCLFNLPQSTIGARTLREVFLKTCATLRGRGIRGTCATAILRPSAVATAVRRIFDQRDPPTAIVTASSELTLAVYSAVPELGLSIPRQVSVLCCDSVPILDFLRPLPTCYQFPQSVMARHVARTLLSYFQTGKLDREFRRIVPELRMGGSVAHIG